MRSIPVACGSSCSMVSFISSSLPCSPYHRQSVMQSNDATSQANGPIEEPGIPRFDLSMSGEHANRADEQPKSRAVVGPPVGEPPFTGQHELWRKEELLRSRKDHGRRYRVLDARHDRGRGNPELLHRLRERSPVLKSGGSEAMVGEERLQTGCRADPVARRARPSGSLA